MCSTISRGRVVLVASGPRRDELQALFESSALCGWKLELTEGAEHARFVLQGQPPAAVVLAGSSNPADDLDGVRWLALEANVPLVLLAESDAELIEQGLRHGLALWLPPALVLARPEVLDAALDQLSRRAEEAALARQRLREGEEHVRHLLDLLWEVVPTETDGPWYTQRHMLQRLEEEVGRAQRQGAPLTVVLGELNPEAPLLPEEGRAVTTWTARRIGRAKRRCDVAGRYGLRGFMLVLPQGGLAEAVGCCRRLTPLLEEKGEGPHAPLRACFGIASAGGGPVSVKGLLGRAEERLAQAREQGGGVVGERE